MATKKEWKDHLKDLREHLKFVTSWVKEQGANKSGADEIGGPGSNPPDPPPPPTNP